MLQEAAETGGSEGQGPAPALPVDPQADTSSKTHAAHVRGQGRRLVVDSGDVVLFSGESIGDLQDGSKTQLTALPS